MKPSPLWLASAYYFFYFGAIGCLYPFLNLYFEQIGLNGITIGALSTIAPLLLLFISPAWGAISDRFQLHRHLLTLATFGPILPIVWLGQTTRLEWLAVLLAAFAFFATPVGPLIDSAVLELIDQTPHSFGKIRVWGSVGFTLLTPGMGYLLRELGLSWMFYGYAVFMFIAGVIAIALPARRQRWQTSFNASLQQLVRQKALILFFVTAFLIGAAFTAAGAFFPLHLQTLGGDAAWIGLSGAIGALSEMPILFYSQRLFRWTGVRGSIVIAAVLFAVRWEVVALTTSPVVALLTQTMHGVTFGAFLVGGVAYVERYTPPGLSATAQALLVAVMWGIGSTVGAFVGGWLYDVVAGSGLFHLVALMSAISVVFVLAVTAEKATGDPIAPLPHTHS